VKKTLLILLCLPLFIFSQEERKYERTMSFSQLAEELKQAAESYNDYTLEDSKITYDPIRDKKYAHFVPGKVFNNGDRDGFSGFQGMMILSDIQFHETSKVIIKNCKFGSQSETLKGSTISFENCLFGELELSNNDISSIDIRESEIYILNIQNNNLSDRQNNKYVHQAEKSLEIFIESSKVWRAIIQNTPKNNTQNKHIISAINLIRNDISFCEITSHNKGEVDVNGNNIGGLQIKGINVKRVSINNNTFSAGLTNLGQCLLRDVKLSDPAQGKVFVIKSDAGLKISHTNIENLSITKNIFHDKIFSIDSIFKTLLTYEKTPLFSWVSYRETKESTNTWENSQRRIFQAGTNDDLLEIKSQDYQGLKIYNKSFNYKQKIAFFRQYLKENRDINIVKAKSSSMSITSGAFQKFSCTNNQLSVFNFTDNNIKESFELKNMSVDSLQIFFRNTLPTYNRCNLDLSIIMNIGWESWESKSSVKYYGNEYFDDIEPSYRKNYISSLETLIAQYRQFVNIMRQKGSNENEIIIRLKDFQTNKRSFQYYLDPNMNTWFNWKGSLFLKWYSDYGMNPFKALSYCFWAMLYFALFYFFFYSDWDKIDRSFLINRFNSVMDYFTTEKRIEDFYSSKHDKEMTTFTEFKNTLDKNKVYMPSMLASLAKPIYQMSLLRYRLLNFSYKKAEFMAGRKWVDLEKKDRYWIGTLTFFLTLTYITYLIFIRALNSIALSVNAFSTLGFGQIPVRGFTKYVAIIEGFIGWFMLSVFIVSLLSQMMSV